MERCKNCGSYLINDDRKSGLCDVCLYKIPLMNLLARVHRDGGQYVEKHGLQKAVADADEILSSAFVDNQSFQRRPHKSQE